MPNIKIFISYKDKHPVIKSEIIQPIQTGRAIADEEFEGMIGDNTGENISKDNPRYCELTAQYWVWKNYQEIGNPDYVGFMHYRRHFLFNEKLPLTNSKWLNNGNVYYFPEVCPQYMEYLRDDSIKSYFPTYDCMVIKPYDVKNIKGKYERIRDNYITLKEQEGRFYDVFLNVIKEIHPDYIDEIEEFDNGSQMYLCNMFVMRHDLFEDYCEFLFSTLKEIDNRIDSTEFSPAKSRFLGFLGEFVLSIYMFKLRKNPNIKIKEMNASFILMPNEKYLKKYNKYKILRHFVFGNLKKRYEKRYQDLKKFLNTEKIFDETCFKIHRPWGYYECIAKGENYLVKRITVKPNESLSVQSHKHRSEIWTVVKGIATVLKDDKYHTLKIGETVEIPVESVHSLINSTNEEIQIVEVQFGEILSEEDITRYQDKYGRINGEKDN